MKTESLLAAAALASAAALALPVAWVSPAAARLPPAQRAFALATAPPQRFYAHLRPDEASEEERVLSVIALLDVTELLSKAERTGGAATSRSPCQFVLGRRQSDALAVALVLMFFGVVVAVELADAAWVRLFPARHGAIRLCEETDDNKVALSVKAEEDVETGEAEAHRAESEAEKS